MLRSHFTWLPLIGSTVILAERWTQHRPLRQRWQVCCVEEPVYLAANWFGSTVKIIKEGNCSPAGWCPCGGTKNTMVFYYSMDIMLCNILLLIMYVVHQTYLDYRDGINQLWL